MPNRARRENAIGRRSRYEGTEVIGGKCYTQSRLLGPGPVASP